MDIDEFVQHLNKTKGSVFKGMKHFKLTTNVAAMTKRIHNRGYKYDKQRMEWVMDIIHTTSHSFTLGEQDKKNVVTIGFDEPKEETVHIDSHDVNSHDITEGEQSSHGFTLDEMESIKVMLNDWKKSVDSPDLVDRIEALPKDEKVRKTIVISESIGKRLDEFCKVNRVQKSDVLASAIEDFIRRY